MFAIPNSVLNRRGTTIYMSTQETLCFYLTIHGLLDGTQYVCPPVGSQIYLEISQDLLPGGTSMEAAIAIMNAYLTGEEITQEDIDLFKLVFPDWAADTYYYANKGISYGMVPYQAINDMTSQEGIIPPEYPELYKLPLTYIP